MARTVRAFCIAAGKEHSVNVDQTVFDMWANHSSPLYQPKPRGLGGMLECTQHSSWACLPGAMPKRVVEPPHVQMSGNGAWNDGVYAESRS